MDLLLTTADTRTKHIVGVTKSLKRVGCCCTAAAEILLLCVTLWLRGCFTNPVVLTADF